MSTASSQDTAARLVATSPQHSPGLFAEKVTSLDLIRRARSPQIRAALLVALGYYVGARIGFALTLDPSSVPTLWPPTPILLAGLLLTPVRSWAVVFAATFAAHLAAQLQGGVPLAMILSTFVSSSAGALVGAVAFRRLHREEPRLDTLRETVILLLCAGIPGAVGLVFSRRRVRGAERLGASRLLDELADAFFLECPVGDHHRSADRDHRAKPLWARGKPPEGNGSRRSSSSRSSSRHRGSCSFVLAPLRVRFRRSSTRLSRSSRQPPSGLDRGAPAHRSWRARSSPSGERSRAMDPSSPARLRKMR